MLVFYYAAVVVGPAIDTVVTTVGQSIAVDVKLVE